MKLWLYCLLFTSLIVVAMLSEINTLLMMLLFPIGVVFNWLFFVHVTQAYSKSIVGFSREGEHFSLHYRDESVWQGKVTDISWNTQMLTLIKLANEQNESRFLILFKDSVAQEQLKSLRAWIKTGLL